MKVLLDEQGLLDQAIDSGFVSKKPTQTISVLIKYYLGEKKEKEDVRKIVVNFISGKKFYNPVKWDKLISKMISSIYKREEDKLTNKYKLLSIKQIGITQRELNVIKFLNDIEYEKFAFAALVHAKVKKLINPINDGWIEKGKELYDDAKLSKDIKKDKKNKLIFELNNGGLTEEAVKVDSKKLRVKFIDLEGEPVLVITDFENFVYDYLLWRGEKNIKYCSCKKLYEKVVNNQKYCKECSVEMNRINTKQNMKKNRIFV